MKSSLRAFLLHTLSGYTVLAQTIPRQKAEAPTSVVIVELFTSEGCSSCPPADELLRRVHLREPSEGQLIVGLSEHVTYWNTLGWQDPYSQELFTRRQEVYASRFSLDGPYTPQMVLNGRDQFVGSDTGALRRALHADEQRKHVSLTVLSATRGGDGVDIRFSMPTAGSKQLELYAALTDDLDQSNVLRGENSGRSLQHASVVRSLTRIAVKENESETLAHITFPKNFDVSGKSGHHVVIFAQEPGQGAIVGAASHALLELSSQDL